MLNQITEDMKRKMKKVARRLLKSDVEISLFALLLREKHSSWDIVIGGKDIENKEALKKVIDIIRDTLDVSEISQFSGVIVADSNRPFVKTINQYFELPKVNTLELKTSVVGAIKVRHGFIFYSKSVG